MISKGYCKILFITKTNRDKCKAVAIFKIHLCTLYTQIFTDHFVSQKQINMIPILTSSKFGFVSQLNFGSIDYFTNRF